MGISLFGCDGRSDRRHRRTLGSSSTRPSSRAHPRYHAFAGRATACRMRRGTIMRVIPSWAMAYYSSSTSVVRTGQSPCCQPCWGRIVG